MSWITDFKKLFEILTSKSNLSNITAFLLLGAYAYNNPLGLKELAFFAAGFLFKATQNGDVD